jgi:hypothetical protein
MLEFGKRRTDEDKEVANEFWPKVFHGFRPDDQKLLVVTTTTGLEVAVQELSRVEADLVMIRGRIAGTAEASRLFLLPYEQLSSIYVNRIVRSEEVELFSPTVTPERKLEVARRVAELERKAKEEALSAEKAKSGNIDIDSALKRLDTLREQSNGTDKLLTVEESNPAPAGLLPNSNGPANKAPGRFGNLPKRNPLDKPPGGT